MQFTSRKLLLTPNISPLYSERADSRTSRLWLPSAVPSFPDGYFLKALLGKHTKGRFRFCRLTKQYSRHLKCLFAWQDYAREGGGRKQGACRASWLVSSPQAVSSSLTPYPQGPQSTEVATGNSPWSRNAERKRNREAITLHGSESPGHEKKPRCAKEELGRR